MSCESLLYSKVTSHSLTHTHTYIHTYMCVCVCMYIYIHIPLCYLPSWFIIRDQIAFPVLYSRTSLLIH